MPTNIERTPVIIFGAGQLGVQLLEALRRGYNRTAVAFVDTEPSLWRQYVAGIKVHHPDKLPLLIERHQVKEILVALPDDRRRERRRILKDLQDQPVEVKVLPAVEDIASGRVSVTDLRPVEVNDLLGRDKVPPNVDLLGAQVARQVHSDHGRRRLHRLGAGAPASEAGAAPHRAVRYLRSCPLPDRGRDHRVHQDDARPTCIGPEIVGVLGSVLDAAQLRETIVGNAVEVIYHAAAYKHVPIVEQNAVCGLRNNTFGTAALAECAKAAGVELVVLISTDKAVRPTNIMGASKRLAELVLQAAAANGGSTIFTMVRFGNVLDSSGSVVKKFRRQILAGGPVTVTHPEIIRYFMSIPRRRSSSFRRAPWPRAATCSCSTWASRCASTTSRG